MNNEIENSPFEKPKHFAWHLYPLMFLAAMFVVFGIAGIKEVLADPNESKIYLLIGVAILIVAGPLLIYLKGIRASVNAGYLINKNLPLLELGAYLFIGLSALSVIGAPIGYVAAYFMGKFDDKVNWSTLFSPSSIIYTLVLILLARSAWILIQTRKSLPLEG